MVTIAAKKAKTILDKTKGLLGTDNPSSLLLITRWGIHTFGMRYAIDVVILDNKHMVVKVKANLKPNRIFVWSPQYKYVLELPLGTIQKYKIKKGEKVTLKLE